MKRPIALVLALLLSFSTFGQSVPLNAPDFTDFVAQRIRVQVGDSTVSVKAPLTITVGELQANLDRIFGFCQSNATECPAEIDRYVVGLAQVLSDSNARPEKSAVRLVVRTSSYIQNAQTSLGPKSAELQTQRLVDGLSIVPVLNFTRTVRMLSPKDAEDLRLSMDQVFELGRANLESALRPLSEVAKPVGPKQIGQIAGSVFDTSRVILHGQWAELAKAQEGNLMIVMPTTDAILYVSDTSVVAADALRTIARRYASKAPNPLSDIVLKWTPSSWELVR